MQKEDIQTIHSLSPSQQAILLHHLGEPSNDQGLIVVQAELAGPLSQETAQKFWLETLNKHEALRSFARWKNLKKPTMIVAKSTEANIRWIDLSARPKDDISQETSAIIAAERKTGIDLTTLPNNRLIIIDCGDQHFKILWICHHLLLDGWSSNLVLQDFLNRLNQAPTDSTSALPSADYLKWLKASPKEIAADFWQKQAFDPCFLLSPSPHSRDQQRSDHEYPLSVTEEQLSSFARQHRITTNALYTCAWALTLSKCTDSQIPSCAVVSSGRSIPLSHIENRVGMFANTAPAALPFTEETSISSWLETSFQTLQKTYLHSHHHPSEILSWIGGSTNSFPFDSLFVHSNFPQPTREEGKPFHLSNINSDTTSTFPLVAAILPTAVGAKLRFSITNAFSQEQLTSLVTLYQQALLALLETPSEEKLWVLLKTLTTKQFSSSQKIPLSPEKNSTTYPKKQVHSLERLFILPIAEKIWAEILDITQQDITPDSNFFKLGGNSIRALQFITKMKESLNLDLPFDILFEAPTLNEVVSRIAQQKTKSSWTSLVKVKEGTRPPLYLVHNINGTVTPFYKLAKHTHPEQPIFGLQSPREPFSDQVLMAKAYLEEIRAHQPEGPYHLGGICNGGVIALEMAQQLRAQGQTVSFLALIDAVPPEFAQLAPLNKISIFHELYFNLHKRSLKALLQPIYHRWIKPNFNKILKKAPESNDPEFEEWLKGQKIPPAFLINGPLRKNTAMHYCAIRDYKCKPYSDDIWLFRTKDSRLPQHLNWQQYIKGKIHFHPLNIYHHDIFNERKSTHLTDELNAVLEPLSQPQS